MEKCRMNSPQGRSYCPQQKPMMPRENMCRRSASCGCSDMVDDAAIYEHADKLPLAMAYVPCQKFKTTFELCKGLQMGTIFPELCKPFCGKRGGCR